MQLQNANGEPVEAFTKEEVEAQTTAAIAAATAPLQEQIKTATEELAGLRDKDHNFSTLNRAVRQTEQEKAEAIKAKEKEIEDLKASVDATVTAKLAEKEMVSTINQLASGDVELGKKIKFYFDGSVKETDTPEQRAQKLDAAYKAAISKQPTPDPLRSVLSSADASNPPAAPIGGNNPPSPELVDFTKRMGGMGGINITDEDIKKLDPLNK